MGWKMKCGGVRLEWMGPRAHGWEQPPVNDVSSDESLKSGALLANQGGRDSGGWPRAGALDACMRSEWAKALNEALAMKNKVLRARELRATP